MLWALKQAPDVPAQCVGVLMGLAEAADKQGRSAYPSAVTLSHYARKSERQVRADLTLLVEAKVIRPGDQSLVAYLPGGRRPVVYDLAIDTICDLQSTAPRGKRRGRLQPGQGVQWTAPLQSTAGHGAPDLRERPDLQPTAGQDGVQPTADVGCSPASPGVQPAAYKPSLNQNSPTESSSRRRRDLNEGRDDAMRLCIHLADRVEANGSLRPEIGKKWLNAARLMLDTDGRSEEQVHKAIDWCQDDEFWRGNVMSMPTLRKQYDQLRLKAQAEQRKLAAAANGHAAGAAQAVATTDARRADAEALKAKRRQRDAGITGTVLQGSVE